MRIWKRIAPVRGPALVAFAIAACRTVNAFGWDCPEPHRPTYRVAPSDGAINVPRNTHIWLSAQLDDNSSLVSVALRRGAADLLPLEQRGNREDAPVEWAPTQLLEGKVRYEIVVTTERSVREKSPEGKHRYVSGGEEQTVISAFTTGDASLSAPPAGNPAKSVRLRHTRVQTDAGPWGVRDVIITSTVAGLVAYQVWVADSGKRINPSAAPLAIYFREQPTVDGVRNRLWLTYGVCEEKGNHFDPLNGHDVHQLDVLAPFELGVRAVDLVGHAGIFKQVRVDFGHANERRDNGGFDEQPVN